jgi:hypothetical protein
VNPIFSNQREWLLSCLTLAAIYFTFSSLASEYEVDGNVSQTITTSHGGTLHASASFTVFVRGCGWLIETMETNEIGGVTRREIGSTNGTEIYECEHPLGRIQASEKSTNAASSGASTVKKSSGAMFAVMVPGQIPIGETGSAVVGHLWLMFASQCYWPDLKTDQLRPVYDWQASVGAHGQNLKVRAEWELLNGPGSLPRAVRYFGEWDATNGLYKITGTNLVGGTLIPTGFIFERLQVGPLNENSFVHEMVVVKRVDVEVTAVRPSCSIGSLIPSPDGPAVVVDRRFDSGIPNRPPSYQNPVNGQWPTVDKSKELAKAQQAVDLRNLANAKLMREQKAVDTSKYRSVVLIVMCISLIGPPTIYFVSRRSRKP